MNRTFRIILGVFTVCAGIRFVVPVLAQWNQEGSITSMSIVFCMLGLAKMLAGVSAAFQVVAKRI